MDQLIWKAKAILKKKNKVGRHASCFKTEYKTEVIKMWGTSIRIDIYINERELNNPEINFQLIFNKDAKIFNGKRTALNGAGRVDTQKKEGHWTLTSHHMQN